MSPLPIVTSLSTVNPVDVTAEEFSNVFPSCAVTRSKTKAANELVQGEFEEASLQKSIHYVVSGLSLLPTFSRAELIAAQQEDPTLSQLFSVVLSPDEVQSAATGYFLQEGMLLLKWMSQSEFAGGELVVQIVVPTKLREVVLDVAHGPFAGHLGVKKTYDPILRYFYWPLLKKKKKFIKTCHVCQMTGKTNRSLKPAPLCPIPAMGQPFEHLLIDCVGPLPPQSQGALERFHQTLKTLLCAYCTELNHDWEEGLPWLLLAAREVTQSSLGFSPNELVFEHKICGPLAILEDSLKGNWTM